MQILEGSFSEFLIGINWQYFQKQLRIEIFSHTIFLTKSYPQNALVIHRRYLYTYI